MPRSMVLNRTVMGMVGARRRTDSRDSMIGKICLSLNSPFNSILNILNLEFNTFPANNIRFISALFPALSSAQTEREKCASSGHSRAFYLRH